MESRTERELIRVLWALVKEVADLRKAIEADVELTIEKEEE